MKSLAHIVLASLMMALLPGTGAAQNTGVTWQSFDMGYRGLEAGNTTVLSVVGQGFVGASRHSNTEIVSGFLSDSLMSGTIVGVTGQEEVPVSFSLGQNYPNPFNPSTTVHFEIPNAAHVTLKVYNVLGQEVITVVDEEKVAGRYDVRIDASTLSSGAYFYRLQAGDFVQARKLVVLR